MWTKLEQEQNLRSQLTHSAQVNNDKIACLEKQFAAISEKFKAETETNAKLKKSNAELTLSCNNKDKLVEEVTEKLEHLQRINTNQAHDIANLQSQLDKAHVNWMQLNDRTQDLESKIISIIFVHFRLIIFFFSYFQIAGRKQSVQIELEQIREKELSFVEENQILNSKIIELEKVS